MKIHRRFLRTLRLTALFIVLALMAIGQIGRIRVGRWNASVSMLLEDFWAFSSGVGLLNFNSVHTVGAAPIAGPTKHEFRLWSDPSFGGSRTRFPWSSLGFRYTRFRSPGFQSRLSATDPTIIQRPPFDYFLITLPYWPFLLLGLPEVTWLLRRWRARALSTLDDAAPATTTADDSIIATDLPCVHCGYNLRTQPRGGRCTECGLPIVDTLNLNAELARSRPGWLKWLSAGNAMLLMVRVVLLVLYAQLAAHNIDLMPGTAVVAATLYLAGILALTRPENPFLKTREHSLVRWQRGLAIAMVLCCALAFAHQQYLGRNGRGLSGLFYWAGGRFHAATLELSLCAWLMFSICIALEYRFLARLAGRLLDKFMTEHCRIAGIGAAAGGIAVVPIVQMLARDRVPSTVAGIWIVVILLVLWQLFVIWAALMNGYCAIRFLQQAWIAERNWRSGSAECPMAHAE
jgi:hypothetical protein